MAGRATGEPIWVSDESLRAAIHISTDRTYSWPCLSGDGTTLVAYSTLVDLNSTAYTSRDSGEILVERSGVQTSIGVHDLIPSVYNLRWEVE